ncbi:hypothetical protein [Kribbella sp. VKM Ac-2568]|uniref:hypothetical protein n=1 Tax=Kribbella sp. VKM Ac-2568 TaxID=2512219 RepID=UPI001053342E|nr:hypothetical protein [Kribbella sp. VKM Ac-2568]TCM39691.1 hypothetical protein EV648_114213 [Kribbella sp. VKM Ac-2568]
MTYDVVVLIEREMSEGDARRVAALHARREDLVDYHLLVSSHPTEGIGGPLALLGSSFADVAGMSSVSRAAAASTATALADPDTDLASVIEHSSRRLRGLNDCRVNVSITHGEILLALKTLVNRTKSQEVVVVAWPETAASFVCSDWAHRAKRELKVPRVRVVEHET